MKSVVPFPIMEWILVACSHQNWSAKYCQWIRPCKFIALWQKRMLTTCFYDCHSENVDKRAKHNKPSGLLPGWKHKLAKERATIISGKYFTDENAIGLLSDIFRQLVVPHLQVQVLKLKMRMMILWNMLEVNSTMMRNPRSLVRQEKGKVSKLPVLTESPITSEPCWNYYCLFSHCFCWRHRLWRFSNQLLWNWSVLVVAVDKNDGDI